MKKMFLTLALVVSMVGVANAQADGKSIGLRLGYPGEVSFQTGLSQTNRLELGLGLRSYTGYSTFSVSGVYQWVWDLSSLADGFNWYAGVGAQAGYYSYLGASGLPLSVLGQVGIEYNFNIPIRLSLDYRPAFQVTGNGNGFVGDGIALGVRYRF
jgi:hypothetical protein